MNISKQRFLAMIAACIISSGVNADTGLTALMEANQGTKPAASPASPPIPSYTNSVPLSEEDIRDTLAKMETVDWVNPLPVQNLIMLRTLDGQTLLASADGRIMIKGGMVIDGWNKKQIINKSDAEGAWKVKLDAFGLTLDELPTYYYGADKEDYDAVLFVDPLGGEPNVKLFEQVKSLGETHRFAIVLTPILHGEQSGVMGRQVWCAQDQQKALEIIMSGETETKLKTLANCDVSKVMSVIALSQILQIAKLPHLISQDGTHFEGAPKYLAKWLAEANNNPETNK